MRPVSERAGAWELLVEVELRRGHMRRSLRDALRLAIQDGRLAAHTVLPSSRRLASGLGVSRGVVTDAYDQLVSEGYLEVRKRFAPEVAAIVGTTPAATEAITPTPRFDLDAVTPDVRLFPRRAWIRAVERALRDAPDSALDYGDHAGRIELRTALSGYLARVRGVRIDASRIVVTQGFTQALDLLCRVLVARSATTMAMETPSHPGLWATVRRSGSSSSAARSTPTASRRVSWRTVAPTRSWSPQLISSQPAPCWRRRAVPHWSTGRRHTSA